MSLKPPRAQETGACLVFVLLSIAYFWPIFFQDKALCPVNPHTIPPWDENVAESKIRPGSSNALMMDAVTLIYPWRSYNHQMFHRGEMPLWNPYVYCGIPHLAQIQPGSTDPLVMPFDWFDPVRGIGYSMALHMALAGLFFYLFLRRIEFPIGPALIGGVLFEFNGMFLVKMGNPTFINSAAWVGLLLFGIEGILRTGRWKSALPIVIAVFLSSVGGHPQLAAMSYLIGVCYLFYRLCQTRANLIRVPVLFLAASAAGGTLAAFQLLPFLELLRNTSRLRIAYAAYRASALPVAAAVQAALPDVFGNPVDHNWWFREISHLIKPQDVSLGIWTANYTEQNLYMGILPLALSVYGCWKQRTSMTLFFLVLALASLGIFFGTPLLSLAYYALPAFGQARPERIVYVYLVSVTVLSAIGARAAAEGPDSDSGRGRYGKLMLLACALFVLLLAVPFLEAPSLFAGYRDWTARAGNMIHEKIPDWSLQVLAAGAVLVAGLALLWCAVRRKIPRAAFYFGCTALIALQLFRFGWRFNPVQDIPLFPQTDLQQIVKDDQQLSRIVRIMVRGGLRFFVSNVPQTLGIFDANGASSVPAGDFTEFVRALDDQAIRMDIHFFDFSDRKLSSRRILDYLNAEFIISDVSLPLPELRKYKNGLFHVYRNADFLPRFFLVNQVEFYDRKEEALRRVAGKGFDPSTMVLVKQGDLSGWAPGANSGPVGSVHVQAYEPQRVVLDVDASSQSILASSEVYYPGWKTTLDGSPVRTLVINTAFRGAMIPPGRHKVVFEFDPDSFRYGLFLSMASLLGIAVTFVLSVRASRNQSSV